MTPTFLQQLDRVARNLTPLLFTLILVMFFSLPFHIPDFGRVSPSVAMMAAFYWPIYRPDRFPPVCAFILGLWQDALVGTPFGSSALLFLLVHWVVVHQRRFFLGKSFFVVWWAFALTAAGGSVLMWLLMMAMTGALLNPVPGLAQLLLTVAFYPFLTWIFARTQYAILRDV